MKTFDLKHIHIGSIIKKRITETGIEAPRICNFLKCTEEEIENMYNAKSLDSEIILKWSKLLKYDLFRIYTQHLILFAPQANANYKDTSNIQQSPRTPFRKNIYTKELIDFILDIIEKGEKTKLQIIEDYRIPKTTLYKWLSKYKK